MSGTAGPSPSPLLLARRALATLGLLLALLLSPAAQAASFDPKLHWRTLRTGHFNIHFHDGEEALAEEMGQLCDRVYDRVAAELDSQSARRVELVLTDHTDSANGYATTLPINTIVIFVTAPQEQSSLNLYSDWNEAILTHELTHILHLDHVGGVPRALRMVLGRIISVNQVSPGWLVEGLATYEETRLTDGGRGRASQADMIKRMTVLEGHFPPLGNMDGYQSDPPYGNLRYLFGQDFVQYIAQTAGEEKIAEWVHTYGRWCLPYLLPAKRVFGKRFTQLYKDWRADMEARYAQVRQDLEAEGLTEGILVSDGDDACSGPSFSPDGKKLVYGCNDRAHGSSIWLADADGSDPQEIYEESTAKSFAWRGDSQAFAFASSHAYDLYYSFEDVYFYDLENKSMKLLTSHARARDPVFSPDGRELLVVTNHVQNNNLALLTIDQRLAPLTDNHDHTQYANPRFSPDGQWLALSVWQQGQRDLWLYRPDGTPFRQLTDDQAIDREPAWSPDGRTLLFVSDRSGISNIYALDLDSARLWQVTNVLGGAFQPDVHPDGQRLAYAEHTWNGEDIRIMELDRAQWRDHGLLQGDWPKGDILAEAPALEQSVALPEPGAVWSPDQLRYALGLLEEDEGDGEGEEGKGKGEEGEEEGEDEEEGEGEGEKGEEGEEGAEEEFAYSFAVEDYSPMRSLLPPRFLSPAVYIAEYGVLGVLGTAGSDTLNHWVYNGYLTFRSDNLFVGGGGSLYYNRWRSVLAAGASVYTIRYGRVYLEDPPPSEGGAHIPGIVRSDHYYYDKRTRIWGQWSYPLKRRQTLFARYSGQRRTNLDPLPENTYLGTLPTRGFLSSVGGGWRYYKAKAYTYSISPEEGRMVSLNGELTSSLLGAHTLDEGDEDGDNQLLEDFDQLQLTAEWREYVTVPWLANHVLGLRGALGISMGDNLNYGSFRLGGSYGEGSLYVLPDEYRSLRGFPIAAVYGDLYYLASIEYRLPIWRINRGFGTIPFFMRDLHGAVFSDMGNAFDELPGGGNAARNTLSSTLVGLGAELRMSMVIGWGFGLTGRLGYAFSVHGDGYQIGSLDGFYAQMGSSF